MTFSYWAHPPSLSGRVAERYRQSNSAPWIRASTYLTHSVMLAPTAKWCVSDPPAAASRRPSPFVRGTMYSPPYKGGEPTRSVGQGVAHTGIFQLGNSSIQGGELLTKSLGNSCHAATGKKL